jgi:hypothetical protein
MSHVQIIGIAGQKQVGKSTAARYLEQQRFTAYAFANPIKHALVAMLGLSKAELEGSLKEIPLTRLGLNCSPRFLMQTMGTEWGRETVDPDIWIKQAEINISFILDHCPRVVIPDIRFENEAHLIRRMGGHIVHIERNTGLRDSHKSEDGIELNELDSLINNNRRIESLYSSLDSIIKQTRPLTAFLNTQAS